MVKSCFRHILKNVNHLYFRFFLSCLTFNFDLILLILSPSWAMEQITLTFTWEFRAKGLVGDQNNSQFYLIPLAGIFGLQIIFKGLIAV